MNYIFKVALVILFFLLGAKIPSIQNASSNFSIISGLVVSSMTLVALFLGSIISKKTEKEIIPSKSKRILLAIPLACFLLALLAFTLYLYTNIYLFKILIFLSILIGAVIVLVSSWTGLGRKL